MDLRQVQKNKQERPKVGIGVFVIKHNKVLLGKRKKRP